MQKITKKAFIELLCKNKTAFISSVFDWNDDRIESGIGNLNPDRVRKLNRRKVIKQQSNSVQFDNFSWLDFNQTGSNEYFEHWANNIKYLLQKNTCDGQENYVIYAL